MLAGVDGNGVSIPRAGAYLATFSYRVPNRAQGTFLIDILPDDRFANQTYILADGMRQIKAVIGPPAAIVVAAPASKGLDLTR